MPAAAMNPARLETHSQMYRTAEQSSSVISGEPGPKISCKTKV